ncbi:hypothetical protein RchiOBHm_Chr1g0337781 [Rosa chinensis]|uniref:Uncharacterized protein n=1 Tax=Rosa chinensis TaxID=74649 RepID=A0A2P6SD13_ROSCH|nr:hypothetical protein RchiOBHm_Chr1g0337781 [Rosa chinensis]
MAPKAVSRGTKRMLGYGDVEGHDHQEKIQQTCSTQNSVGTITESDGNEFVRSDQGDQRGGKQIIKQFA